MPTLYWPFSTSQVSEWPGQRKGSYHYGTDFAVAQGSILRATVDGVITRHNNDGLGAYVLDIMSDDGLLVRNGHLSRMDVSTGQRVKAGQVIGLTGGRPGTPGAGYSFGPHLHWELRRDRLWSGGAWIDPRKLNPQPLNFGQAPTPQPTPNPTPSGNGDQDMLTLYYKLSDGYCIAASLHTGYWWHLPEPAYIGLMRARQMVRDQNPIGLPDNEWGFLMMLLDQAKANCGGTVNVASVKVDEKAIAKAVNDDAARRLSS